MKYYKGFAPVFILVIVLGVLAVGGGAYFAGKSSTPTPQNTEDNNYQSPADQNSFVNTQTSPTTKAGDYSFQAVILDRPDRKWNDVFVEIYKNEKFVKSVQVGEEEVEASMFVLSPDKKNVAFKVSYAGGTCMYGDTPRAINLDTFSLIKFENNAKLSKNNSEGYPELIESIKWISDSEIEAVVGFGTKFNADGCGGTGTSTSYTFKFTK